MIQNTLRKYITSVQKYLLALWNFHFYSAWSTWQNTQCRQAVWGSRRHGLK